MKINIERTMGRLSKISVEQKQELIKALQDSIGSDRQNKIKELEERLAALKGGEAETSEPEEDGLPL